MTFFPPGVEFGDRTLPAILIAATLIYILFPGPIEPDTEYLVRVKDFSIQSRERVSDYLFLSHRSKECNHGKQDANRAVFHNRREYFIEVHTLSLTIALCNQACEEFWIQRLRSYLFHSEDSKYLLLCSALSRKTLFYSYMEIPNCIMK
ncbi:hypothetical protein (mitochondrion) [Capsicum annuum]|uniref:Uncharacterized protein n=2 Tax=Capsicum annuum TaxID=4072 RepID=A0A075VWN4_CAPAN|nr:hypothetical protein [Capsicum annuum]AIG90150.1 hypothetical protein [Capsicum annuum]QFV19639.1 hypothetical protein [Capsicum annuum var. glabriusculum]